MKRIIEVKAFIEKQIADIKTRGPRELFRKLYLLTKVFIRIPINIIAITPCLIIRLMSPWIIARIERIPCNNFGDFVSFVGLYYCKKKLKIDQPTKKHIDLFYFHSNDKFYNKQIAKMWKRKLNFLSGYLLDPISRVNKFIPGWEKHSVEIFSSKLEYDVDNLADKYQPLDFTKEEEIYGKKMLNKFGLKNGEKFVCLAVRDGAFDKIKNPFSGMSQSHQDFRNCNIDNFKLASEELTKKGYYIFRMGVVAEKSFNLNNPKIIDYANSNLRNDFMDVYLGAKCSFCISTGLGFHEVPYIFGKPVVIISAPFGVLRSHNEKFLLLTKHHIYKENKKKLSMSDIFSSGVAFATLTKNYEEKGIELIDNSPEEIKDIAIEMAERLELKNKLNSEDEKLQKTFQSLFASNFKDSNYRKAIEDPFYKIHGEIRSRFSTKFLRENKDWLS